MNPVRAAAALVLIAALAAAGDRAPAAGRVVSGPGAERPVSPLPREAFHVFGWLSPPADSTTDARMAEMAGAGINLALPALEDAGRRADNRRRLDLAWAHGIRCILFDARLPRDPESPAGRARLDGLVADYRAHPGFFGYYLGDEPPRESFAALEKLSAALRARDAEHPAWNNLIGRSGFAERERWLEHHREYLDRVRPAVLCNDQYDFYRTGDRGRFVENAAGLNAVARERGVPFWGIVLLMEHGAYRALTPGELKWQVSTLLAHGARGIGYFTYWTPRPDPAHGWRPAVIDFDGSRTPWYDLLAGFNPVVRAAGETLARLTWLATVHAGSVPPGATRFEPDGVVGAVAGRAALGHFADTSGRRYLLVANSDSAAARTVTLTLPGATRACVLGEEATSWAAAPCVPAGAGSPVALALGAGSFALVRLEGAGSGVVAGGAAPGLAVVARGEGEVAFRVRRVGSGGRFEIADAGGWRAWSRAVAPGETTLAWRGERDAGGQAPAGLYYARLEDVQGLRVAPFAWGGAR